METSTTEIDGVTLESGAALDIDQIRAHLTRSLAKYKLPVEITILDELPKNPVGKFDKPSLRKKLTADSNRV